MNQNEQSIKGKFYQNKTYSEKSMPGGGKEKLQSFQLLNLLEKGIAQNLTSFLDKDHPSPEILNQGIISLIKKYQKGDQKLYEQLFILFSYGASPNIPIIYDGIDEINSIKEGENVTLLMFGIKIDDLKLINLVLNFNPEIDKTDFLGRNAIIYAVIFGNKDSTDIINLLIKHKANINYSLKLQMSKDRYEIQSVFTIAIFQDLKNITKCLLDNNVDVSFRTEPKGDTGLHIAAQYAKAQLVELLLNYPKIRGYIEVKNNEGKTPIELVKEDDKEKNEKINIFKHYYNVLNNFRINNQNMKMIYSEKNYNNLINMNINPQLNKMQQQMNQQIQLNKMHEINNNLNSVNNNNYQKYEHFNNNNQINMQNMNNGKLLSMNNSPNPRYNYIPPDINLNMVNQSLRNNNMNISNNFGDNKNINHNKNIKNSYINNDLNQQNNNNMNENIENNVNNNNNINYNKNNNELEKNINRENEKDTNININYNQRTPEKNQFLHQMNSNNKHQNISNLSPNQLYQIKNKLNKRLLNNKKINYNVEIPIEFIKKNHNKHYNNNTNTNTNTNIYEINNFIKQNNIPILNLDLSSKSLSLELKLIELKEKLQNLNVKWKDVSNNYKSIKERKEIQKQIKDQKKDDLEYTNLKINENQDIKNNLIIEQKNLLNKIPADKRLQESNKNISNSQIRTLKFGPPKLEEKYIIKALNKDLIDYEKYIDNKMLKKKPKIILFLKKFKTIIDETFHDLEMKIEIFGAYAQGLSLPWSDLKIVLINNNSNNTENIIGDNITDNETSTVAQTNIKSNSEIDNYNNYNLSEESSSIFNNNNNDEDLLRKINDALKKNNLENQLIINEKGSKNYVFISTDDEFDKIKIYISIDNPNHQGLKILELVKSYMKEYPPMRRLILALGTILKSANLNKVKSGGLSSYGLILMVVSFIQSQRDNITNSFDLENINGKLFYDFLNYYGINFDFNKFVIITYLKNEINSPLTEKENQYNIGINQNKELTICDPLNKKINVAKPTYQFMNIKMAFMIAFMVINEDCECGCHYGRSTFEYNYISTEHCYLKRIFNSVKRFNET